MKTTVFFVAFAALVSLTGCATTGAADTAASNSAVSAANTQITLDQALQKAAQARQQVEQAKTTYQNVKAAAKASKENNTSIESELVKQTVKSQINTAKKQFDNEVQEWKDILKN